MTQTYGRGVPSAALIAVFIALTTYWATRAEAAEATHVLDARLSLTGICKTTTSDPVEDPGCPGGTHPPGGRFVAPTIAIDNFGDMYVGSFDPPTGEADAQGSKGRVDVFTSSGVFITEIPAPRIRQLAVDTHGNLYAYEESTSEANLTELKVWEPSSYDPAHGAIAYASPPRTVLSGIGRQLRLNGIALDRADGHLFFDLGDSVSEYGSASEGNPLLTEGIGAGSLTGSKHIAVDALHGRLYASREASQGTSSSVQVLELTAPHHLIFTVDGSTTPAEKFFSNEGSVSIATEESTGDFFVSDLAGKPVIYDYSESGSHVSSIKPPSEFEYSFPSTIESDNGTASPNEGTLYLPSGIGVGSTYAYVPNIFGAPDIDSLAVRNVGPEEAEVTASVTPRSPSPGYVVEYEPEEGGAGSIVADRGTLPVGREPVAISVALDGLAPGTSYKVWLSVENEFGEADEEVAFSTFEESSSFSCPNEAARVGPSADLPDCRAYELVTPSNTGGLSPRGVGNLPGVESGASESVAEDGSSAAFAIRGGVLPGFEGAGNFDGDPYLSSRGADGWTTQEIGLTGAQSTAPYAGPVSPDHLFEVVRARHSGPFLLEGSETTYLRYPDGTFEPLGRGSLGIEPGAKILRLTAGGDHVIFSSLGSGSVGRQLEPDAPPTGTEAIYDRPVSEEVTHVVSLLPGDVTPGAGENAVFLGASADGSAVAFGIGRGKRESDIYVRLDDAVTEDVAPPTATFEGLSANGRYLVYLNEGSLSRFDTATEETLPISSGDDATVVNVPADGSGAYFLSPDVLEDEGSPLVNPENRTPSPPAEGSGFLGADGTGTFTAGSTEVTGLAIDGGAIEPGMRIAGPGVGDGDQNEVVSVGGGTLTLSQSADQSGPISFEATHGKTVTGVTIAKGTFAVGMPIRGAGIPAGAKIATIDEVAHTLTLSLADPLESTSLVGQQALTVLPSQNLYFSDGSATHFVATVTNRDVEGEIPGNGARVYGLGLWAALQFEGAFAKDPSLTTADGGTFVFESRAAITGFDSGGHSEIYRYDALGPQLSCISCSPSNEVPSGDAHLQSFSGEGHAPIGEHAQMRGMDPDGSRVFFQTEAALVASDTDGVQDVYEWEIQGTGSCARGGGCISLISSGHSASPSYFFGSSASGDDAFLLTSDLLVGADTDPTPSIYDAHVDGGSAVAGSTSCLAEGCRGQSTPPPAPAGPASIATGASGNVKPKAACRKGTVKKKKKNGKVECVTNKPPKHKKKTGSKHKKKTGPKHKKSKGADRKGGTK